MKPGGVQLASPILPPGRHTRRSSEAARSWLGVNITPKVETTTSKLPSSNGQGLGIGLAELDCQPVGGGALAGVVEQGRDIIGGDHVAPAACGRQRDVAVAGGDVEHALPGADVQGLAQGLRPRSAAWCRRRHSRPRTTRPSGGP